MCKLKVHKTPASARFEAKRKLFVVSWLSARSVVDELTVKESCSVPLHIASELIQMKVYAWGSTLKVVERI